jgi:tRNA (cytosine34-C5)-methyltransferase
MGKQFRRNHPKGDQNNNSKRPRLENDGSSTAEPGHGTDAREGNDSRGSYVRGGYNVPTRSKNFDFYYKSQNIVPESEFEEFAEILLRPLPSSFRITEASAERNIVQARLENEAKREFFTSNNMYLSQLPWYPGGLGWQMSLPRQELRKVDELKSLHQWIIGLNDNGLITRQEAVSMIPPLLLDVQPDHFVLDMCASPGSKTSQMLEALHAREVNQIVPRGLIVANDNDSKRAYMLVHQLNRLRSTNIVITCHDAQMFPNFMKKRGGLFDRVLADVPCSGDGTARKNVEVFGRFSPSSGLGLHTMQLNIAMRGLELLKTGGYMVYSTCSFNPIENEAVVAEIIRRGRGTVEIVDVSSKLPGLITSPGLLTWKVIDQFYNPWDSYLQSQLRSEKDGDAFASVPKHRRKFVKSLFPPESVEVARDQLHLDRCIRLLPHKQDTGGFFVALLHKKGWPSDAVKAEAEAEVEVEAEAEAETVEPTKADEEAVDPSEEPAALIPEAEVGGTEEAEPEPVTPAEAASDAPPGSANEPPRPRVPGHSHNDSIYVQVPAKVAEVISREFGLLPQFDATELLTRSQSANFITLASPELVHQVVPRSMKHLFDKSTSNEKKPEGDRGSLKIVNLGIKVFQANPKFSALHPQAYRLLYDGASVILPFVTKQVVYVSKKEFITILKNKGNQLMPENFGKTVYTLSDVLMEGSFLIAYAACLDEEGEGEESSTEISAPKLPSFPLPSRKEVNARLLLAYPETCKLRTVMDISEVETHTTKTSFMQADSTSTLGDPVKTISLTPKFKVPVIHKDLIPHALQHQYAIDAEDPNQLVYSPRVSMYNGSTVYSAMLVSAWRSTLKVNLMVHPKEIDRLMEISTGVEKTHAPSTQAQGAAYGNTPTSTTTDL